MKQLPVRLLMLIFSVGFWCSCHKLEVPVKAALTPGVFPQTDQQFLETMGTAYAALRGDFSLGYWFAQTLSTDEGILMARGGNWYDNQQYSSLHYHNWTPDHGFTNSNWTWLSRTIGTTNQALAVLDQTMPAGKKDAALSELKIVRAIAYFIMMDLYGNVPIYSDYGDLSLKTNSSRTDVFNFIEKEVKDNLANLSSTVDATTYGRVNRYTAWALLAKMYLNAQYYTGTARYDDCIAACDTIIASGKYALEPRSTYLKMFYPNNGPSMHEFIFVIPFDPAAVKFPGTNGFMYHARYDVPRSMGPRFSLPFKPEGPECTLPEFYAHFNDPNDIRNQEWLTGLQYYYNGSPVLVTTTKKGYDQFYTGSDGSASYTYQVNLTPDLSLRQSPATFDAGNDEIAWNMGYRNIKFYPDSTSISRNQNNDVPLFRYSDIILMKAEAILRGGKPTMGQTALSLYNDLRGNRTTSAPATAVSLEDIYGERCRELVGEAWHRNDMIRFGKFEDSWGFKTDADVNHRIFPIPTSAFTVNPTLKQNPGY